MTTFFTLIFIFFIAALVIFGIFAYKIYSQIRKVKRAFGIGGEGRGSAGTRRESRKTYRRRGRRGPIIPKEYAVDVQYTEERVTGAESFLSPDGGATPTARYRRETQISDAEYEIIDN